MGGSSCFGFPHTSYHHWIPLGQNLAIGEFDSKYPVRLLAKERQKVAVFEKAPCLYHILDSLNLTLGEQPILSFEELFYHLYGTVLHKVIRVEFQTIIGN